MAFDGRGGGHSWLNQHQHHQHQHQYHPQHMTAPLRTHYVSRNTNDYSNVTNAVRDYSQFGQSPTAGFNYQRPTRMHDLVRDRKRQAIQDLEEERSFRQKNEIRQFEHSHGGSYPYQQHQQQQQQQHTYGMGAPPGVAPPLHNGAHPIGGTRPQSASFQPNYSPNIGFSNRAGTQSPAQDRWWNHPTATESFDLSRHQGHNTHIGYRPGR
eukprot:TRINITY_DN6785_c1_g1_i2.p1 TRINITY_DN6785_c1_g1~~TRINITY_DN6785_c1_g1_i2.p1  ORF type:complete len:210 (+),score=28.88 TRINITY_DN6785_c1_g1_i2:693-1322(+)